ncbi:MAG: alpha/beta fold hydrolase [Candidatus Margulisbacteria bacterium]|nr:alpha/beta fold hydrolase [Candidatus Margulisiibacteriota bacterium]
MIFVIVHGMMEHCGRYDHVRSYLESQGHATYCVSYSCHFERGGWDQLIENLHQVIVSAMQEHPSQKVVLLGHSMGSYVSQLYATLYGENLHALVLTGTSYESPLLMAFANGLARLMGVAFGFKTGAQLIHHMVFDGLNKAFKPNRTDYDWLCSDPKIVDAYMSDPLCGQVCTFGFYRELFSNLALLFRLKTLARLPKSLPIFMISGAEDSLSHNGKRLAILKKLYERVGHDLVSVRLYPGRHEILNEPVYKTVLTDVLKRLADA